ncbi:MAG: GNAT family N-acetyltransferase [Bacteroidia bacterium]|nr:GNAT family N-acetyltransferase [Bacteroidia bacterium]NNF84951.1 GNAT family N-acetyltransferase [Winogradskyella sp.]
MITLSENTKLIPIGHNDHQKLVDLVKRIYPPAYKHMWQNEDFSWYFDKFFSQENFENELSDKNSEYYFIYYDNKLCGIFKLINKKQRGDLFGLYIHRIYLGEEAQGKGVAQMIMLWAETKALNSSQKLIWLDAMDTQQQAIKFYQKLNYKQVGTRRLDFNRLHENYKGMIVYAKTIN